MQGVLLIDKPPTWTSFDVVNYIRKIVAAKENKSTKQIKVGHAGTLDPFATGLLIVLVGKDFTKRAEDFMKLDKTYSFTAKLGFKSTTGDPEGEIEQTNTAKPEPEQINAVLDKFRGKIEQTPPSYSAIKVDGQRSYKLAREGKVVAHMPRPVEIKQLKLKKYSYPDLELEALVSSGTYIRSLVEDIGLHLGTDAYTTSLRRLSIDKYSVDQAIDLKSVNQDNIEHLFIYVA